MGKSRHTMRAQSFLMYSILIIVVIAAIWAMRAYLTRAVQAKFRQSADSVGMGKQYEPGVTNIINSY